MAASHTWDLLQPGHGGVNAACPSAGRDAGRGLGHSLGGGPTALTRVRMMHQEFTKVSSKIRKKSLDLLLFY